MAIDSDRRLFLGGAVSSLGMSLLAGETKASTTKGPDMLWIDAGHDIGTIDPIWRRCAGSDRASVATRAEWQSDLSIAHHELGIERVRFHNVFGDELGVFTTPFHGEAAPNFLHIDAVYDALLATGVRPYVELGFMPSALASGDDTVFSYRANVTPPRTIAQWQALIEAFARHLIARYGIAEVSGWLFEVWNEPNLSAFWTGGQDGYFELYRATVQTLKTVDHRLKVGGPSTAQAAWISAFLAYCRQHGLPVDFVSTHAYPGDPHSTAGGEPALAPADRVAYNVARVRREIDATAYKGTPLWLSEWSSESPAVMANIISGCLGQVAGMSYWTFSGVFEELGPARSIFGDGDFTFGLLGLRGIRKPSFHALSMFNRLGGRRLAASEGPVLAGRRTDGTSVALVWNVGEAGLVSGIPGAAAAGTGKSFDRTFSLSLRGGSASAVRTTLIDMERGSARAAWRAMGSPASPTGQQLERLRGAAVMPQPTVHLAHGAAPVTHFTLAADGLAMVEFLR